MRLPLVYPLLAGAVLISLNACGDDGDGGSRDPNTGSTLEDASVRRADAASKDATLAKQDAAAEQDSAVPSQDDAGASTHLEDASLDAAIDSGADAATDGGLDAATDSGVDASADSGSDAAADSSVDTSMPPPACVDSLCGAHASCVDDHCACATGFSGNGTTCTNIDECSAATSPCAASETCLDTPGSFQCARAGEITIAEGRATTRSTSVSLQLQEPHNLVVNPGSETGNLAGWTVTANYGSGWKVVTTPALFGTRSVVTSFSTFRRRQYIDLLKAGYTAAELDAAPSITIREWVIGTGTDLADNFELGVSLLREDDTDLTSQDLDGKTSESWTAKIHTFSGYGPGLRALVFYDGGSDEEGLSGNFGAALDQASVVLGGQEMRFSNDGTTWSAWVPFAATYSWTLASGAGTKTVQVQYRNAAGMALGSASDTITLQ